MSSSKFKFLSLTLLLALSAPLVSQTTTPILAAESSVATASISDILKYQQPDGGWRKNYTTTSGDWAKSTIDNGATYTEIRKLAKEYSATKNSTYSNAAIRGINCLLDMQYANGGWPQIHNGTGYHARITYNDNAMINVMTLLDEVANKKGDFAFVDNTLATKCKKAVDKGLECILKTQVIVNGKLTVWGQQHDEYTLAPAGARAYEVPSLCSSESVAIVKFLLTRPATPEITASITAAANWFKQVQITGIKVVKKDGDVTVVASSSADPVWGRFYEIGTNRPIFVGRDGIVKYNLADIEKERRTGYTWYGKWPSSLLYLATDNNNTNNNNTGNNNTTNNNTSNDNTTNNNTNSTSSLTVTPTFITWDTGYTCSVKVNNPTNTSVNTWTVKVLKADFNITNSWNCSIKEEDKYLIITPASYNATIAANGSVEFGFQGAGTVNQNCWISVY